MAVKVKLAMPKGKHPLTIMAVRFVLVGIAAVVLAGAGVFAFYYFKYEGVVDERLKQPLFANTAKIFAAPREGRPGQKLSVQLLAAELRQAGYTTDGAAEASPLGTYSETGQSITVNPGPQSFHAQD